MKNSSSAGYIYPTLWLQDHYGKKVTDLPNVITLAGYGDAFAQAAAEAVDIVVCYADGRNDYEAAWTLPTGQNDETGKTGMGRTDSIWNELNVIGVTRASTIPFPSRRRTRTFTIRVSPRCSSSLIRSSTRRKVRDLQRTTTPAMPLRPTSTTTGARAASKVAQSPHTTTGGFLWKPPVFIKRPSIGANA